MKYTQSTGEILLYDQRGPNLLHRDPPESLPGKDRQTYAAPSDPGSPNEYKYVRDDTGPTETPGGQPDIPDDTPPMSHRVVPPNYGPERFVRYAGRVLYHVPPDGKSLIPRPLHGGKFRRSETKEPKEDLRLHGFPENSPVIWLSPRRPISRTGPYFEIDSAKLDSNRLIPTFSADGSMLYVGDIPGRAIVKFQRGKTAATIGEITRNTSRDVLDRSKKVPIRLRRADPKRGIWTFQARGSKGELYKVRVKGIRKGNVKYLDKAHVLVSCDCNFFRWQGPEHWAKVHKYLYGRPRGTATTPRKKDPRGKHWMCKHLAAALQKARRYRFASTNEAIVFVPEWFVSTTKVAERWIRRNGECLGCRCMG